MPSEHTDGETWRQLAPRELEREYSPSSCIGGNYLPLVTAYETRSAEARALCGKRGASWRRIQYGAAPTQYLELCLPPAGTPATRAKPALLVFIHGGYWQELSAGDSLFPAVGCIEQGAGFAAINYTLAPDASVADIVTECRLAMSWLLDNSDGLGFDAARVVVAGSSAGAHLAAMVALPSRSERRLRAAVLVSGIYALEPLVATPINAALGLTATTARQTSPALLPLAGFPDSLICWGANETAEFKRQSRSFASDLTGMGTQCEAIEIENRNHFDVIMDLADPGTELGRKTLALLHSAQQ